jgi:dTDP-4-amino-4,6-dideoxygalactose transaminase
MIKFLDLRRQYLSIQDEVDSAISSVLADSAFIGGERIRRFEREFATYQHAAHCIGVANGTDALEIGLEALGLPPGSEVVVPANTFIATSEAVTRAGHRVVFADVDPVSYTLDLDDVRRRISPCTAAVIPVHLYGHPCDLVGLASLASEYGLRIIEDAAQAHGAEINGRRVGAIADLGVFSFYPGKNLGAYGDAGAIVTNDMALAERCRMIANHGRIDKYDHLMEGRNSRLDGVQAAILSVKLGHLDSWIDRRNQIAARYRERLSDVSGLVLPGHDKNVRHAYHLFVVRTKRRDALAKHLLERGVETGIHYPISLPKLKAYAYLGQASEPMRANRQDVELLSLPIGEHMGVDDADVVADAVLDFLA